MKHRIDFPKASPAGFKAMLDFQAQVNASGLEYSLIELVKLRASQINGCAHCIDMHSRDLLKEGLSVDKLVLVPVWREALPLFDEREQAALQLAESVTNVSTTGIPDADFEAARKVFSDKELVDLMGAIAIMNAYNRIGVGFRATPGALER